MKASIRGSDRKFAEFQRGKSAEEKCSKTQWRKAQRDVFIV